MCRRNNTTGWGLALLLVGCFPAAAEELRYVDNQQWLDDAHRAPLTRLIGEARRGRTDFEVVLPAQGKELAVKRLVIIRDLLAREAGKAVVLTQVSGKAAENTVQVTVAR